MGHQDNSLHRRRVDTGRFQGGGSTTAGSVVEALGFMVNQEKSYLFPFQELEFLKQGCHLSQFIGEVECSLPGYPGGPNLLLGSARKSAEGLVTGRPRLYSSFDLDP